VLFTVSVTFAVVEPPLPVTGATISSTAWPGGLLPLDPLLLPPLEVPVALPPPEEAGGDSVGAAGEDESEGLDGLEPGLLLCGALATGSDSVTGGAPLPTLVLSCGAAPSMAPPLDWSPPLVAGALAGVAEVPGLTVFATTAAGALLAATAFASETAACPLSPPRAAIGQSLKTCAETSRTKTTIAIEMTVTLDTAPTRYLRACLIMGHCKRYP